MRRAVRSRVAFPGTAPQAALPVPTCGLWRGAVASTVLPAGPRFSTTDRAGRLPPALPSPPASLPAPPAAGPPCLHHQHTCLHLWLLVQTILPAPPASWLPTQMSIFLPAAELPSLQPRPGLPACDCDSLSLTPQVSRHACLQPSSPVSSPLPAAGPPCCQISSDVSACSLEPAPASLPAA